MERKKEFDAKMQEFVGNVDKILQTFGQDNRGQIITQWNHKALCDVMGQALMEFNKNVSPILEGIDQKPEPQGE